MGTPGAGRAGASPARYRPLDLIKCEARLLDDGEFERWIELFSRERIYWIPLGRGKDPRREVSVEFHDRRRV
jgi:3-phenylpropionate/cinnamic acid dioxygenase small subunit